MDDGILDPQRQCPVCERWFSLRFGDRGEYVGPPSERFWVCSGCAPSAGDGSDDEDEHLEAEAGSAHMVDD